MLREISADIVRQAMRIESVLQQLEQRQRQRRRQEHARKVAVQQAKFRGWRIYEAGGMLCDCATSDEAAGWQASRDADAAMRRCEVR